MEQKRVPIVHRIWEWSSASCHGVSHSLQSSIQYPSAEFPEDPLDTEQKSNPRSLRLDKKSELNKDKHELVLSLRPTAHWRPGRFWKLRNSAVKITESLKEVARTSATSQVFDKAQHTQLLSHTEEGEPPRDAVKCWQYVTIEILKQRGHVYFV